MSDQHQPTSRYPLLEAILAARGLALKAIYTNRDAGEIFGVSIRTIQEWILNQKLSCRDLPGRGALQCAATLNRSRAARSPAKLTARRVRSPARIPKSRRKEKVPEPRPHRYHPRRQCHAEDTPPSRPGE